MYYRYYIMVNMLQVETDNQTPISENLAHLSVTTVLSYCKSKILKPYLRLLNITGLRSFSNDQSESITLVNCCSYLYIFSVILLMIVGYLLQYMACFRRDRGFGYVILESGNTFTMERNNNLYDHICNDSVVFVYVIPHALHFMGYIYAFLIFRSSDDDQLPSLMETVSAARLSTACETIRSAGHETRVRPFSHQETPRTQLDSILLYSANLRMNAKLFGVAIKKSYLYFYITICVVIIIILGQLHYFVRKH
ncbi:hypothetical protein MML48_3g00004672 [Holotrichia oblita]|uniref:Uncharacterized protein n=1 Tax=Holotrichia oblita TaxID=644536 RepID=A0ACB9TDP4_HOLOL|nr:hypothetical protein MML48_3g00004672 [Holotrichia oblita]